MSVDHKAVMAVADLYSNGWLCSCGRTILFPHRVAEHFKGQPMTPAQLHYRRLEGFSMHISSEQ